MKTINSLRLKRRTLLKGLGVVGLASIAPCSYAQGNSNQPLPKVRLKLSDYKTFRSTCAMECLHCNLTAYTYQGKLMKIQATEGFNVKCCLRGISRTKWVYHDQRIKTPLLRVGEKGKAEFKPISWDEALDLIEKISERPLINMAMKGCLFPLMLEIWTQLKMIWGRPSLII